MVADALAVATYGPASATTSDPGKMALVVIAALVVMGLAQYVAWRAFDDHWKALLASGAAAVGTIYLLLNIFP